MIPDTEYIACNLCRSNDYKTINTKFNLDLVKCKNCGLIYANPRLTENDIFKRYSNSYFFNEYLPIFGADSHKYNMDLIRNHYFLFLQLAYKYFAPGYKLLDVGCAAGFFLKAAEEMGWAAEGVEISSVAVNYAKTVVKVNVHCGKLEDIHIQPKTYDVVTLLDTLEHLSNPFRVLIKINHILKTNGIVIMNTPDFNSLSRLLLGQDWAVLTPAEHLYYFTKKTLKNLISRANFRVLGIRNLLNLNPEYTHNKSKRRYRLWKNAHQHMEKKDIMEKIFWFEYSDIMSIGDENPKEILDQRSVKKIKKMIYKRSKTWLRGDMLIGIAKKYTQESQK